MMYKYSVQFSVGDSTYSIDISLCASAEYASKTICMYVYIGDGIWHAIQERRRRCSKPVITDIIDGKNYRRLCEPGQFLNNPALISFIFNTDGAALYSSSGVSLWPVFLAINELPSPDRFSKRNMMLWGIWQGKGKPSFNTFFETLITEMSKLYNEGIIVTVPQMELTVNVKVAVLLGTTDLQGKAYVVNMTQHNGESGCVTCEETGIVITQGKGHTRCYPYRSPMERAPKCTTETLLENAFQANERQRKVAGMVDVTSLALMPWFDIVLGMVPDYMHGCFLGIRKTLLYKWFSSTNYKKDLFIGGQIKQINKRVLQMRPPDVLARLPRDLEKHFKNLKASELQSWLLYYALPCLVGFLPDKYLQHFAGFSEGIYILLDTAIYGGPLVPLLHTVKQTRS
ncbi:PREDICTED: uncharacterized protein LOC107326937 isoform X1 [Acropora digitifera]|uniref:uncharacterized protein LOC107326937 isoform X1 n=1 Tax=Acropora digitifera TaxID=70779 RepID=UPI00077A25BB|nr:PREDICTED: uncharacterized protein LOC107326937 isoform X1 [Acropora digitifera]